MIRKPRGLVQDLNRKVSIETTCSYDLAGLYGASLNSKISEKLAGFAQNHDISHGLLKPTIS
jgi:hypothetical protein